MFFLNIHRFILDIDFVFLGMESEETVSQTIDAFQ